MVVEVEEEEEACLGMGSRGNLGVHRLHDDVEDTIHTEHRDRWPRKCKDIGNGMLPLITSFIPYNV